MNKPKPPTVDEFEQHIERDDYENFWEIGRCQAHWRQHENLHCLFCGEKSVWYDRKRVYYFGEYNKELTHYPIKKSETVELQTPLVCLSCGSLWMSSVTSYEWITKDEPDFIELGKYLKEQLEILKREGY